MATRANIARRYAGGSVRAIYSHWDGYVGGVGKILAEHYSDPAKVEALLDLGSVSVLRADLGEKHNFKLASDYPGSTFYGRDRNETGVDAIRFDKFEDVPLVNDYFYLFDEDGKWYWFRGENADSAKELVPADWAEDGQ